MWERQQAGPAFETLDELFDRGEPEVVVVASPPHLHASHCIAALEAGAHVVCEKPFVERSSDAELILEKSRDVARTVIVNQQFRYMPIFSAITPRIGSAGYGRLVFIQVTQFMDLPPWKETVPWRAAMPNRTLFEGGVHIVDLVYSYLGVRPRTVFAVTSSGLDTTQDADAIHLVTLDFGDGVLAQITIDRLSKTGTRYLDMRVDCEDASIRASYGGRAYLQIGAKRAQRPGVRLEYGREGMTWVERGDTRETLARNPRNSTVEATKYLYQDAFQRLAQGDLPLTSAEVAKETLEIIEAAYESAATGQAVALRSEL